MGIFSWIVSSLKKCYRYLCCKNDDADDREEYYQYIDNYVTALQNFKYSDEFTEFIADMPEQSDQYLQTPISTSSYQSSVGQHLVLAQPDFVTLPNSVPYMHNFLPTQAIMIPHLPYIGLSYGLNPGEHHSI